LILPLSVAGWGHCPRRKSQHFSMIGPCFMGIGKELDHPGRYANQLRRPPGPAEAMRSGTGPAAPDPRDLIATPMAVIPPALACAGTGSGRRWRLQTRVVLTATSLVVVPAFYLSLDRAVGSARTEQAPP
jgi:hypothetical protein